MDLTFWDFIEVQLLATFLIEPFDPVTATLMGHDTLNVEFEAVGESVPNSKDVNGKSVGRIERFRLEFVIILTVL